MGKSHDDDQELPQLLLGRRLTRERERLIGMTDEERAWRARFLKDQILDPDEPIITRDYYKQRYNIIRRFYRAPLDVFERMLTPTMGSTGAYAARHITAKTIMTITFFYFAWYHMKYNPNDWTRFGGWRNNLSRVTQFPSDPGFPAVDTREKGNQFAVSKFDKSPI